MQSRLGKSRITGIISSMKACVNSQSKLQRRLETTLRNADKMTLPQMDFRFEPKIVGNRQGLDGLKSMWMELFSRMQVAVELES